LGNKPSNFQVWPFCRGLFATVGWFGHPAEEANRPPRNASNAIRPLPIFAPPIRPVPTKRQLRAYQICGQLSRCNCPVSETAEMPSRRTPRPPTPPVSNAEKNRKKARQREKASEQVRADLRDHFTEILGGDALECEGDSPPDGSFLDIGEYEAGSLIGKLRRSKWEVRLNGQETWFHYREALGELERLDPKAIVRVSQARRGEGSA